MLHGTRLLQSASRRARSGGGSTLIRDQSNGRLWHMLRVTRVPECRVRLLVGARPKGLALPSWAGLELGMGSYRGGKRRGARRGHCGTCHTCRPDGRMQDEIAGGTGTGQAGGSEWSSDALRTACGQPLVEPSCSTKVSYEPDWASAAGADSGTMVVARRRRLWTARAAVHWVGMGDDAGPPSGEGQWKEGSCLLAASFEPIWMSCRVVMVV